MGQPLGGFLTIAALIIAIILGAMWGIPQYRVYSMKLSGEAILAEAESSRQVAVKEALAAKDSATFKAEAEVIRAKGVAEDMSTAWVRCPGLSRTAIGVRLGNGNSSGCLPYLLPVASRDGGKLVNFRGRPLTLS